MPVLKDTSLVADSTISLSSPASSPPKVQRPTFTYGRKRPVVVEEPDTSFLTAPSSSLTKESTFKTGPLDLDEEIPPSSDPSRFSSDHAGDDDDDQSPSDAPVKFSFGWKQRLKELDEDEVIENDIPTLYRATPPTKPSTELTEGPKTRSPSPVASNQQHNGVQPSFSSLSTLSEPLSSSPEKKRQQSSPAISPIPVKNRTRIPRRVVVHDSDSDSQMAEGSKGSPSSLASTVQRATNPAQTSTSSDDDEMPVRVSSRSPPKAKGSLRHRNSTGDLFDSADDPAPSDSDKKGKSKEKAKRKKTKTKAPTKKDLVETAKARVRLAAERTSTIPRPNTNSERYSMPAFFSALQKKPRESVIPSSDPIIPFSSSPAVETNRRRVSLQLPPPTFLRRRSSADELDVPTSRKLLEDIPALNDSDEEVMPEVSDLLAMEQRKQEEEAKLRNHEALKERKRMFLAQQKATLLRASTSDQEDDDDDLEIIDVEDHPSSMRAVVEEESAERKSGKKIAMSEGRRRQLIHGGISLTKRPDSAPSPKKSVEGKLKSGTMSQKELAQFMAQKVLQTKNELTRQKEEEWVRRGGKVAELTADKDKSAVGDALDVYVQQGLERAAKPRNQFDEEEDDDDEDDNWAPEGRGSGSPSPHTSHKTVDNADGDGDVTMVNEDDEGVKTDDEDLEVVKVPVRSSKHANVVESESEDDNDNENTQVTDNENGGVLLLGLQHRGSLSSFEDPTEDENDKENNDSLMFDRSEDKENKAVVRHALGSRPILGGIVADEDPFSSPKAGISVISPFTARLQRIAGSSTSGSLELPSTLQPSPSLKPFFGGKGKSSALSQFSDEEVGSFKPAPLQPSFSDLFESGTEQLKPRQTQRIPLSFAPSLSDPFIEKSTSALSKLRKNGGVNLDLTQEAGLQPAFQAGEGLIRKAELIFEKEQEYLIEVATKKPLAKADLYVNDAGFLTQTRPDVASPEVYRPLSPSQKLIRYGRPTGGQGTPSIHGTPSDSQSPLRRPLRTLSLTGSLDFDSPGAAGTGTGVGTAMTSPRRRRLVKRIDSPPPGLGGSGSFDLTSPSRLTLNPRNRVLEEPLNAFDVLARAAKAKKDKPHGKKLEKSDFIEEEAQESDDDEMMGFGLGKKEDGEEEEGEDLDRTLETLVDDAEMTEADVAADKVHKLYQEQQEEEDQRNQKLHENVVNGQLRLRKRDHGIAMSDSEDEDEDDEARRRRQGMHKRHQADRDDIRALAENDATNAFYRVYETDLLADDSQDFAYLQKSQDQDMANDEQGGEDETQLEESQYVSREEIARRVRALASRNEEEGRVDLRDVSWVDREMFDEGDVQIRVKQVSAVPRKTTSARRWDSVDSEFDDGSQRQPSAESGAHLARLQSWAKDAGARSRNIGTGRSGVSAAVTGHAKLKVQNEAGSGRVKGSSASVTTKEPRKLLKSAPSMLDGVADRSSRFK